MERFTAKARPTAAHTCSTIAAHMICPVCTIDMIAVERHGIEVDHCISCRGLWFDRGEIELLAELTGYEAGAIDAAVADRPRPERSCPRCDHDLEEITRERVHLDRCPAGDGVWFDRGELGQIMQRKDSDRLSQMERFLGEVFGTGEN